MADDGEWTVGRMLNWTTEYLQQRGAESARLDTEVLLSEARGCDRIDLYTAFQETVTLEVREAFRELVRRRAEGMPVAYLVGRREFYSHSFRVNQDVLIPRPETEFVVIALLDLYHQAGLDKGPVRIADIGTGSGFLAICAGLYVPHSEVVAIDPSAAALEVAARNAEDHGLADRVRFVQSDLFAHVDGEEVFDFVISNPPYVSQSEWESLDADVREFEPRIALVAGPKGTEVIIRLIPQAAERLTSGGWLILEISPQIEQPVLAAIDANGGFESPSTIKDLAHQPRVIATRRR